MKTLMKISLVLIAAGFITATSFGQKTSEPVSQDKKATPASNEIVRGSFVDTNNNGVCDNYENRSNAGKGRYFVDENGDGICDKRGAVNCRRSDKKENKSTCRQGRCGRNGRGYGQGFHGGWK
jgi:hypothetical protein